MSKRSTPEPHRAATPPEALAAEREARERAERERDEALRLAYIGEHRFPDLTWKHVADRLARQVEGLRADLRSADETVSALHTLLWDQQRNVPRVDGANDLIWLLHDTLRRALAAAAPEEG